MIESLAQLLDRTGTVRVAAAISLALGLFFTFIWAPHPWGWQGIDQYHYLASALARGEPFATTDVPWGYAYFAAAFYWLFGERIWIPLTVQVIINASAPLLLYRLVRPHTSQRVAVLAALITGVFSFNNVYASTQASDALCTILFLVSLLVLARAITTGSLALFAVSGLLLGVVPQFRPNMVLFPALLAAGYVLYHRTARHLLEMAVLSAMVIAALTPWIVRNYQLTGLFIPTSTHGGVQLWYGTLQTGPYLESRAHNPRSIFESAPFNYTSLPDTSLLIELHGYPCTPPATLVYWTDRDPRHVSLAPVSRHDLDQRFEVPGQPIPTTVYYYLRATPASGVELTEPPGGSLNPHVWFVDAEHIRDIDRHDDVLDIFDVMALMRHLAWREPITGAPLDLDGDGAISRRDLDRAVAALLADITPAPAVVALTSDANRAILELNDGSTVALPSVWSGLHTDLEVDGSLSGALVSRSRTLSSLRYTRTPSPDGCVLAEAIRVNQEFYRREPHQMRRYLALARDNIRRDPWGFAAASAYRMVRLFIIRGSSDVKTAQQFSASEFAYAVGTTLSAAYFVVFVAGAWLAWKQRSALVWLLLPIAYVPLTICFVLTNMRYTVTMQPLMFVFVAIAVAAALFGAPTTRTLRRGVD
ncbi:MAG TPA: glycosyltransferase family 39 protein [Vicinamibacterales bacterium]|nr:glycosyltransferase family 39 protein [Vicinamibacterales bacterium]